MVRCNVCGGFVYEDEPYYDESRVKWAELTCINCGHSKDIPFKKWQKFKASFKKSDKNITMRL